MKNKSLCYSVREQTEFISQCQSLPEMQTFMLNLESEFEGYSICDQGFLLAMIGMTIMKLSDDSQHRSLHESRVKLLLLARTKLRDVSQGSTTE